ncbi:hypothetical protein AVEN_115869-1 [Araneus ventricosus]|uniref:Uncharacterized protein n=1 Tax=Araneus ventricosus TaxID=182803 RepID=A0A4Y2SD26_ARAVE|nr:hypothetical protein AVEN_115869-1 [Araneus ventricosus]
MKSRKAVEETGAASRTKYFRPEINGEQENHAASVFEKDFSLAHTLTGFVTKISCSSFRFSTFDCRQRSRVQCPPTPLDGSSITVNGR